MATPVNHSVVFVGLALALGAGVTSAAEVSGLSRTNLLVFSSPGGALKPVRTTNDWLVRRASVLRAMQEVMGPLPGDEKRCPLDVRLEEEVDCGSYVRRLITYASEPGSRVPAYLLIPQKVAAGTTNASGILCLHQTHALGQKVVVGLGASPNDQYAVDLAQHGYVCIAPPYPLLANYAPDLKKLGYASGTMKAIWDNMRALDVLEALPFVRRGSFGAIGHSLGGHNGIYTAVFDQRLKVVVSSCGFDSYRDYMDGNITGWTSERYMPRLRQYAGGEFPFDFHELIGALAPRRCFVSAPIGDTNFKWRSVDAVTSSARKIFELFGAPENLRVEHPNCGHEFPKVVREAAYEFLERTLR